AVLAQALDPLVELLLGIAGDPGHAGATTDLAAQHQVEVGGAVLVLDYPRHAWGLADSEPWLPPHAPADCCEARGAHLHPILLQVLLGHLLVGEAVFVPAANLVDAFDLGPACHGNASCLVVALQVSVRYCNGEVTSRQYRGVIMAEIT